MTVGDAQGCSALVEDIAPVLGCIVYVECLDDL